MAFNDGISSAVAQFVFTQSSGAVTEPVNGSYIQAYCEYLGVTETVNDSWLQALCIHLGITEPLHGSWTIALANYYGLTYPTGGTWWMAMAEGATPPQTDLIWDLVLTQWQLETTEWATVSPPSTPTFNQDNQLVDNATTLTGTADPNTEVNIELGSGNLYSTTADALGDWTQAINLEGAASPGLQYVVTITSTSSVTGLTSAQFTGSVYLLTTSKTISFNLTTYWSLYWYSNAIQVEQEVTPGNWTPIEYEGNPTWVRSTQTTFYKTLPYRTGIVDTGYSADNIIAWQDGDNSGEPQGGTVVREVILDTGFNYRIVAVPSTSGTNYANYAGYAVYDGATEILPLYRSPNSSTAATQWAIGNVQQTFTL